MRPAGSPRPSFIECALVRRSSTLARNPASRSIASKARYWAWRSEPPSVRRSSSECWEPTKTVSVEPRAAHGVGFPVDRAC